MTGSDAPKEINLMCFEAQKSRDYHESQSQHKWHNIDKYGTVCRLEDTLMHKKLGSGKSTKTITDFLGIKYKE